MSPRSAVVPDRVRFALEVLDPRPGDRILEIGGGPGVAAALICDKLETGSLLVIDRSATAIRRTAERNADHIQAGRLAVRTMALHELELPENSVDAAFSVNVNLFWTRSPAQELTLLSRIVRAGAAVHICYDSGGPQAAGKITTAVADALEERGFVDVTTRTSDRGLAISARTAGDLSGSHLRISFR